MQLDLGWLNLVLVALLWGVSNPLMKKASQGIVSIGTTIPPPSTLSFPGSIPRKLLLNTFVSLCWHVRKMLHEFVFLFKRPLYCGAFGMNMLGSIMFYLSLGFLGI
jgi:drug/metabolite transporter (DMT)-like permease